MDSAYSIASDDDSAASEEEKPANTRRPKKAASTGAKKKGVDGRKNTANRSFHSKKAKAEMKAGTNKVAKKSTYTMNSEGGGLIQRLMNGVNHSTYTFCQPVVAGDMHLEGGFSIKGECFETFARTLKICGSNGTGNRAKKQLCSLYG